MKGSKAHSAYRCVYAKRPEKITKIARQELGLTQRHVAVRLGVSQSQLSKIESKRAAMSATFWFYFCRLVHLDCERFFYGYCKRSHMNCIRGAIRNGDYQLPASPKLLVALEANKHYLAHRHAESKKRISRISTEGEDRKRLTQPLSRELRELPATDVT